MNGFILDKQGPLLSQKTFSEKSREALLIRKPDNIIKSMNKKFQPPRGTRDFFPEDMIKRNWIADTIRAAAESFGYGNISTPGIESWELLGKKGGGGEEIKKEVYVFEDKSGRELGLRFEFTASFARFLANNPQLPKPFKRYQMGPFWRYDRPQAGRYREFFGCEIDIAGSPRPEADAEIIAVTCEIFRRLGFKDFTVRISNRQLLEGMVRAVGVKKDKVVDVFRSIDKLDKIGVEGVKQELKSRGIGKLIPEIMKFIGIKGCGNVSKKAGQLIGNDSVGKEGLENLRTVIECVEKAGFGKSLLVDLSIVRGLEYYTGCVFEIAVKGGSLSLGGGGRYDNLVELYGGNPTPCVGIGLGFERIFETMVKEGMFKLPGASAKAFVVTVDKKFLKQAVELASKLRALDVSCDTDLMGRNLRKQLECGNARGIPWAVFVGERELRSGKYTLRNMKSGKEQSLSLTDIAKLLK